MTLSEGLAQVETLSRGEAVALFEKVFASIPTQMKLPLIRFLLKKRLQEMIYGELQAPEEKRLKAMVETHRQPHRGARMRLAVRKFYRREWRGTIYEVEELDDGTFLHEGKVYRSLTAVAFAITGKKVNGPLFFTRRQYAGN